jgi:hypothetical protein
MVRLVIVTGGLIREICGLAANCLFLYNIKPVGGAKPGFLRF